MIRDFDTHAILQHPRVLALSADQRALYLGLLSAADPSGTVPSARVLPLTTRMRSGTAVLEGLIRTGLVDFGAGHEDCDLWACLPSLLDSAEIFEEAAAIGRARQLAATGTGGR